MFDDEVAVEEDFEGVVNGSSTDFVVFLFHFEVEGFCVEVVFAVIDGFEEGKSFGGFAQFVLYQVIGKDVFYGFYVVTHGRGWVGIVW